MIYDNCNCKEKLIHQMYIYMLWSTDEDEVNKSPNPNKYVIQHIWIKFCITEKKAEEIMEKQAMTILSYKNEVLNSAALTFIWNINYFRSNGSMVRQKLMAKSMSWIYAPVQSSQNNFQHNFPPFRVNTSPATQPLFQK